ncbi:DTW domain-containing protein [Skeletonema marinoi]|uniref:tRNA-uridine aminocarboxypropyltransferase n=1 Tax=Skeletonema marinoi TaxID=267567 RepID=A0AAD8YA85_9STRA|nr:DTW domain-containing protein [Skeletonema marinoi]
MEPSPKDTTTQKKKRAICDRCKFPKEKACICKALLDTPLSALFNRCRVIVLQHPHELRRKNRSLPLVELALFGQHLSQTEQQNSSASDDDFVMKRIVGRRIGEKSDDAVLKLLSDPNEVVVLVFPHPNAMDLEDGLALAESKIKGTSQNHEGETKSATNTTSPDGNLSGKKMTLIFIDASWKHAKEMDNKTEAAGVWPKHLIRVQLTPSTSSTSNQEETSNDAFVQRRFQIRAPPSPDHLSTAECLAWIASRVEGNSDIYEGIMKVLDYMVELWRGFARPDGDKRKGGGSFTDGDGCREMTQKRRKITSNKK